MGRIEWEIIEVRLPARSLDVTPFHMYILGCFKNKFYCTPQNTKKLEEAVVKVVDEMPTEMGKYL